MNNLINNTIKGIPVFQNNQDFIVSVFTISQILRFTKFTKRLIIGMDEEGKPIYNEEIQRFVENSRIQKIADYLMLDPEATFPTNLVLHIPREIILEQELRNDVLELTINDKVFSELNSENGNVYISIIDGQHRVRGIEVAIEKLNLEISTLVKAINNGSSKGLETKLEFFRNRLADLKNIQLVVTFFVDKTLEYQAMVFSTINRTQKKVSADLVSSLFGLNTSDSPQKTALQVVLSLNGHEKSPFYKRIKLYGGSYAKNQSPPLTQSGMVKSIVSLISENLREAEKDRYRKRQELLSRSPGSMKPLPFRKFYAIDKDSQISDTLFYFFNAIRIVFKNQEENSYWEFDTTKTPTNIFHTTVGYEALLKILVDILETEKNIHIDYKQNFIAILKRASELIINDVNRYPFNNRGKKRLYLEMSLLIYPPTITVGDADTRQAELQRLISED